VDRESSTPDPGQGGQAVQEDQSSVTLIDSVTRWISAGYYVYPVRLAVGTDGKKVVDFPGNWRDSTNDPGMIGELFFGAVGIAVDTGKSGVVVLDIDTSNGKDVCALAVFKDFVGINIFAPPEALADPKKKLEGSGKKNRMLKVRTAADIDSASILKWLKAAVSA